MAWFLCYRFRRGKLTNFSHNREAAGTKLAIGAFIFTHPCPSMHPTERLRTAVSSPSYSGGPGSDFRPEGCLSAMRFTVIYLNILGC